jgi:hypothetical protein
MKKGSLFKSVRVAVVLLIAVAIAIALVQLRPRAEKQARTSEGQLVEVVRTRSQTLPMIVDDVVSAVKRRLELGKPQDAAGKDLEPS